MGYAFSEALQQAVPDGGVGVQSDLPFGVVNCFNVYSKVCKRGKRSRLFGPFCHFEPRVGKNVPETRVLPFTGVVESVEVEVPDHRVRCEAWGFVGLYHRIGRAFDAALHAERAQQVPHQRGFAGAQVAVQGDESVAQGGLGGQVAGKGVGVVLAEPSEMAR